MNSLFYILLSCKNNNLYGLIKIFILNIKFYLFFVSFLSINPDKGSAVTEFP